MTPPIPRDLAYAIRLLARNKAFTAVAVATLALGIGANTAIFALVDGVVFRPLPYREPGRLVKIWDARSHEPTDNLSWVDFDALRAQRDVFEQVAADDGGGFNVRYGDAPRESVLGAIVTTEWLSTLGVQPLVGRAFLREETEQRGRDRVILLGHAYWQRRFAADPQVVGTTVHIDNEPHTIVGVLPPNVLRYGADFLKPLVPADYPQSPRERSLDVFARLKPGITLARAQAVADTIARRVDRGPLLARNAPGFAVAPLGKYYADVQRDAERALLLMLAAVSLVLLIACANVTNLLLGRALTRSRECVVRTALGASRGRLVRQMLAESLLLFAIGGALGFFVARWTVDALLGFAVSGGYVPSRLVVDVDLRVLAFSLAISLIAGVLAGLVPALQASRVDLSVALRASAQTSSGVRRRHASRLLIVAEIAVSLVLLVGSGLLIRSFLQLRAIAAGIDMTHVLLTTSDGGRDFPVAVAYWRAAIDRARALPGVRAVAVTSRPPIHGARGTAFRIDADASAQPDDRARAGDVLISADYFRTMGVPLLKGRAFTARDDHTAAPVAIVSQSLARRYFGDANPVGRRISLAEQTPMTCCATMGPVAGVWREIVGVAADVRQGDLDEAPAMTIYRPYTQIVEHDMFLTVRAASAAAAGRIAAQLPTHLTAASPMGMWSEVRSMQDVIDGSASLRLRRFVLTLLGSFAALALLLAAVGTYGVMMYAVTERTREIGIRVALGATRVAVLGDVLGETLKLTIAGLIVGGLAAYVSTRFLSTLLFAVSASDALTYIGAALVLATVALLASYLPARRAMRIDPLVALRQE